jgi:hypothetical protein
LPDEELLKLVMQQDWELKLTAPTQISESPIQLLNVGNPDYSQTVQCLPAEFQGRVCSVRKVAVDAHQTKLRHKRDKLTAARKAFDEVEPLYHGTAERWRATAIAMNGFDLSIRLNGRALGDGVYSTTDPAMALGYAGPQGSLLVMKGIATDSQHAPVYVFADPTCILPMFIVDFSTSVDEKEREMAAIEEKNKRLVEQHRQMLVDIEEKERQFKTDTASRVKKSMGTFKVTIEKLQQQLQSTEGVDFVDTEEDTAALGALLDRVSGCLQTELRQRNAWLPVYQHKRTILDAVKAHSVVIISSETGSGKSTQIPQYLLGDLDESEGRKVAVLQPRRANAVALCSRVSAEMGSKPGSTVGYSIGGGVSNTTEDTRIEFMTHGLFLQLATHKDRLLKNYCAVVLDEAHERR